MDHNTQSIQAFLDDIASETVTPAGGSAAAVVGAIGASLGEMAATHSLGDGGNDAVEEMLKDARSSLATHRSILLEFVEEDARIVASVFGGTADIPSQREMTQATGIPLGIAGSCLDVLTESTRVIESGSEIVVPDALTGIYVTHGALRSALFTVQANLEHVENRQVRREFAERAADIEAESDSVMSEVVETVDKRVSTEAY